MTGVQTCALPISLRYAPPGSAIELTARNDGDAVALFVVDHGDGIAPEHLPHLFDRFYKVDASRVAQPGSQADAPHGSGLGLSIVKAIVERHGGQVSVESRPGHTAFQLRIPRM
mgnify:FL=1